jgi:hypothetical protein
MRVARLYRSTGGGAVVETVIAFPVFFAFFSMIVQLCYLEVAGLTTQHAANIAARAAVVVAADDPRHYGGSPLGTLDGARGKEVEEAVRNVLRTSSKDPKVRVTFSGGFGEGSTVKAKIELDYDCWVPPGGAIVCGASRRSLITREASMPSQTAGYEYP